ncbi:MAG: Rrf2 family transcriptional regulator [Phycisphaerae bacterium]|jgi:Rrf2 family protein
MISRTVEYALRAMVWLASSPDRAQTTRAVAQATQIPASYLSKVLQTLVDAELLSSQRGLGGGFVLARPPERILVLDVVNAVDPIRRIRTCPLRLSAHSVRLCALHQRLDDALATVEDAFARCTIRELLADGDAQHPLCPPPASAPVPLSLNRARPRERRAAPRRPSPQGRGKRR